MKIKLYCTCGDSCIGTVKPDDKAEKIVTAWRCVHSGKGHQDCDQKTAAKARRKADRQDLLESVELIEGEEAYKEHTQIRGVIQ